MKRKGLARRPASNEPTWIVARLLDGEKMAGVCEEFGISRKTGYKIFQRYQAVGLHGLTDRSRRPFTTVARFWYVRKAPPSLAVARQD